MAQTASFNGGRSHPAIRGRAGVLSQSRGAPRAANLPLRAAGDFLPRRASVVFALLTAVIHQSPFSFLIVLVIVGSCSPRALSFPSRTGASVISRRCLPDTCSWVDLAPGYSMMQGVEAVSPEVS